MNESMKQANENTMRNGDGMKKEACEDIGHGANGFKKWEKKSDGGGSSFFSVFDLYF
jgi:hypothetical protein